LIWRIRTREGFQRLERDGRRARAGVLWCTFVLDSSLSPPQVAFAFGRAIGPAVTRNLMRRRVQSILRQQAGHGVVVPPGVYLIGASPSITSRTFSELVFDVRALFSEVARRQSARR
jgi:ribonuclease P protein component